MRCVLWDDHIVTGHSNGSVQFREPEKDTVTIFKPHSKYVSSISSNGGHLASTSIDGSLNILGTKNTTKTGIALQACTCLDENFVITGNSSGDVCIWNIHTLHREKLNVGHTQSVRALASADTRVASSDAVSIRVYGTETAHFQRNIRMDNVTTALSWSVKRPILAAAGYDRVLKIYDMRVRSPLIKKFLGHTDCILSTDFSTDGNHIATGGSEGVVKIWDMRSEESRTISIIPVRNDIRNFVYGVAFSPGGKKIVHVTSQDQIEYHTI